MAAKILKNLPQTLVLLPFCLARGKTMWTFFLAILVVLLFFGNALLSLTKPKKQKAVFEQLGTFSAQPKKVLVEDLNYSIGSIAERQLLIDARLNALDTKVLMAHERLQNIESIVSKNPGQSSGEQPANQFGVDVLALKGKVDRLLDFKANAEIELAAIKDALREKGILKPLEKPKASNQAETEFDQKARAIVFQAATRKNF